MNISRCENGHFFDGDKYQTCPHCGASVIGSDASTSKSKVKETSKSIFGRIKKDSENDEKHSGLRTGKTIGLWASDRNSALSADSFEKPSDNGTAFGNDNGIESGASGYEASMSQRVQPKDTSEVRDISADYRTSETRESENEISVKPSDDGKTTGFFSRKPVAGNSPSAPVEPCVGWLVCVKGVNFGRTYNIVAGKNSVGRNEDNNIALVGDTSVSREKHAWILFDPKNNEFFVMPGEGSGLLYVNDEMIMEHKKIKMRDMLEIGDGKYIFMPLCSDEFKWEDYL